MQLVALAGGVGAGKFLRGLQRVALEEEHSLTVIVNTGDDLDILGLHVSPDLDSVCYWLSGRMDRDRGWGVAGDTFHAMEALREIGDAAEESWFSLGDRDLATHLWRTRLLREGGTLSEATRALCESLFDIAWPVLPMSDDPVTTRIAVEDRDGGVSDLHFQEYWVKRGAADPVKAVRFEGVERSRPAPGVLEAIGRADVIVICPSNPVVSIGPILAVPGIRDAVAARSGTVVGVSPIVRGEVLAGMADRLMPVVGLEVSAAGAARAYAGILAGWLIDDADRASAGRIADELGIRVAVADTVMRDDGVAADLARAVLQLAGSS